MPDDSDVSSILIKYFDSRLSNFETAVLQLRTDYKEHVTASNVLLANISDKIDARMKAMDDDIEELQEEQLKQKTFIGNIKWVVAFMAATITAILGNSANSILHFIHPDTIQVIQQAAPPALPTTKP